MSQTNQKLVERGGTHPASRSACAQQPRAGRSLRPNLQIPLLEDRNMSVACDYGGTFHGRTIDPNGTLRQIALNHLPIGRSVDAAVHQWYVSSKRSSLPWVNPDIYIPVLVDGAHGMRCGKDKHREVCPANLKEVFWA